MLDGKTKSDPAGLNIVLSENLSYCPGVKRTLRLVEKLLQEHPDRIFYMLGEIIHNEHVIFGLKQKGLRMIRNFSEIRTPGTVIIQSHGAPKRIYQELKKQKIPFIDATCPMVKVIHKKIRDLEKRGYFPVVIGKNGHEEAQGIVGQVKQALVIGKENEVTPEHFASIGKAGIVVQSTFIRSEAEHIVKRIKELVGEVKFEDTICGPTQSRQEEIEKVSQIYDCILIVGSKTSANTSHLFQMAQKGKASVYLIDEPEKVRNLSLSPRMSVFIASGASTPPELIDTVIHLLKRKIGGS